MRNRLLSSMLVLGTFLLLTSCAKDEGLGGNATIKGTLIAQDINNAGQVLAEYPFPDERVYIVFGDAEFYGDEQRTHFDGTFKFDFLRTGTYTVYAYSDCNSCLAGKEAVLLTAEITDNNQVLDIGNLYVKD